VEANGATIRMTKLIPL